MLRQAGGRLVAVLETHVHNTPHHTSYAVAEGGEVHAVFSGGCVMVGACGRTDLIFSVYCRTGHRSAMATSILAGAGIPPVLVDGGFPDWLARGFPMERDCAR